HKQLPESGFVFLLNFFLRFITNLPPPGCRVGLPSSGGQLERSGCLKIAAVAQDNILLQFQNFCPGHRMNLGLSYFSLVMMMRMMLLPRHRFSHGFEPWSRLAHSPTCIVVSMLGISLQKMLAHAPSVSKWGNGVIILEVLMKI
ncbi:hypothetical protein C0J52_27747, partial [Blattella germanica]